MEQNEATIMQKGVLNNSFWDKRSQQMQEVVAWVLNPHTVATYEAVFEAQIATPIAYMLAIIINKFHEVRGSPVVARWGLSDTLKSYTR